MSTVIKKIRKQLGLSQIQLAHALQMAQSTISHYEKGCRRPEVEVAQAIINLAKSKGYQYSLDEFYTGWIRSTAKEVRISEQH